MAITKESFKLHAKDLMGSFAENGMTVVGITSGMIISQKFLDANAIATQFKTTANPNIVKYQGGIKAAAAISGLYLLRKKKLPNIVKLMMLGVAIQGTVQQVVALSNGKVTQIGDAKLDEEMKKMAEEIRQGMHGTQNPTQQFIPSVAGSQNPTEQFIPSVAGADMQMFGAPNVNLNDATGVGYLGYTNAGF